MQTRAGSAFEACCNTASGFAMALLFTWAWQRWVAPIQDADGVFSYVLMMTMVSVLRSYLWRRAFEWRTRVIKKREMNERFGKVQVRQPAAGPAGCRHCGAPPHAKCKLTSRYDVCPQEFEAAFGGGKT